jgi:Leucine-rich repeat (LRR) protein
MFLSVSTNGLQQLSSNNFANAGKLKKFFTREGFLTRIRNATFRSCPSLENLQIFDHKIKTIEVNAFQGLNKLYVLGLENNSIEVLHPMLFAALPNLNILSLELNQIKKLSAKLFLQNPALLTVSLTNNQLSELPSELFSANLFVKYLSFDKNQLTSAQTYGSAFIDFSFNKLNKLELNSGTEIVKFENNVLEALDCSDVNLTSYKRVFAENNSLTNFNCIRDMENLTELDLTRNKFPRPTQDVFTKLTQLKTLSMFNQTKFLKIAAKTFSPLKLIENLRIDRLADYRNLRQLFPKISIISLTTRTWNCSYTQQVTKALSRQKIRMSYNNNYDRYICNIKQTM